MTFLIIYGILAFISLIIFYTTAALEVKRVNSFFKRGFKYSSVSIEKVLFMAVFFPIAWTFIIINAITGNY